ncbi:FAD-binding oxidoreductase [Halomonas sp. G11]|uniref:FAD-binding oxidoreductase n=1 Tax=Halomonas sp. G11 TaxID=1684425 RepID=UPI0008006742|nr:FAD-binding oxidoreductase [Halomonas sp. G11]OBA00477.1 NAD(P)H-flavin reductase [Halomonas sp. G11]
MSNTVTLANSTAFEADPSQTILQAAFNQSITLEYSCRTGRCGICKAEVISGKTEVIKPEESLTSAEKSAGLILTCCRSAATNVQLAIEDLGELGNIQPKTVPCRIDEITKLAPDVVEVTLRTPPASRIEYLPGQYVDMIGKEGLRRSYSIANAPRDDGKLTLQIRKVENGEMSHYWFNEAKSNDLLRLEGPLGTFCLRKTKASRLVFLATGTGIAPVKAMLEQLASSPEVNTYSQIDVYWGARTEEDLYWKPKFPALKLHYTPVLTRSPEWAGAKGYIQQVLLARDVDLQDAVVYACGSEDMINSAHAELTAAGLAESQFHSDAFVSSN